MCRTVTTHESSSTNVRCSAVEITFRYLFRYRDLLVPTINAHKEILDAQNSCWWGWWKRPSEETHISIWQAIEAQLNKSGQVDIGLFDSGSGEVRSATISQVIRPKIDEYDDCAPVRVPEEELPLVPEYYRSSSGSRGWMRLIRIGEPIDGFFGEVSFAASPALPQYTVTQLARLEGKVVLDADELRGMDTTLWEVRGSTKGDSNDRFLTPSVSVSEAVSDIPVATKGEWVLHISDLHYADDSSAGQHVWSIGAQPGRNLVDALTSAIEESETRIGAVIVTGDLTFRGTRDEFKTASDELFRLTYSLELSLEHLIVVPGNHDILWTEQQDYDPNLPVTLAPNQATAPYRAFFRQLFRYDANPDLSMARRFVFPGGRIIDVVALNSSSLKQGANYLAGMGRTQESAFTDASHALRWRDSGQSL